MNPREQTLPRVPDIHSDLVKICSSESIMWLVFNCILWEIFLCLKKLK